MQIYVIGYLTLFLMVMGCGLSCAQQTTLYNSQTLAESADNPWVAIFDKDCQQIGFNFLIPAIATNTLFRGEAVAPLLGWSAGRQAISSLLDNSQRMNRYTSVSSAEWISVKINRPSASYVHTEWFFGHATRVAGWGTFKNLLVNVGSGLIDEGQPYSLSAADGPFNGKAAGYAYNETSAGWRADLDEDLFAGVKLAYLSGITYADYQITESSLAVTDRQPQMAVATAAGRYRRATHADSLEAPLRLGHFLPNIRNPGIALSAGIEKWLNDRFKYTLAIKDLGMIYWGQDHPEWTDNTQVSVRLRNYELFTRDPDDANILGTFREARDSLFEEGDGTRGPFTTFLPTRLQAGASALLYPNYTANLLITQTLLQNRTEAVIIHDLHKQPYHLRISTGYDSFQGATLGLTFLLRTSMLDVFAGTDNLLATFRGAGYLAGAGGYRSPAGLSMVFGVSFRLGNCDTYARYRRSANRNIKRLPSTRGCCQF